MMNGKYPKIVLQGIDFCSILDSVGYLLEEVDRNTLKFSGPRFPPVGHAYDREYLSKVKQIAKNQNLELREGVYCGLGKTNSSSSSPSIDLLFRWTLLRNNC